MAIPFGILSSTCTCWATVISRRWEQTSGHAFVARRLLLVWDFAGLGRQVQPRASGPPRSSTHPPIPDDDSSG